MKTYIAAFKDYHSALRFRLKCADNNINASIVPIPKRMHSLCKTGVKFDEADEFAYYGDPYREIEQIVRIDGNKLEQIYSADWD